MSNQNRPPQGMPPQGQPPKGMPPQGMPPQGPGFGPGGRRGGPGGPMGARLNKEKPKNMGKTLLRLVKVIGRSKYFLLALVLTITIFAIPKFIHADLR